MSTKTKPNYKLLALGGLFLLPPGWVVFDGLQRLNGMPTGLAVLTVGSLAIIAIALVFLALQNLEVGDVRDASLQLGGATAILVAEFVAQWWFAWTEGHALVTALVMSMLSVGGALIIEGEVMRVWKANARANGTISLARPHVPREVKKLFPDVAEHATRFFVRYPNAAQALGLDQAFAEHDRRTAQPAVQGRATTMEELTGRPATPELPAQVTETTPPPVPPKPKTRAPKTQPPAEEPTVTATVTSLASVPDGAQADPRVAELLPLAQQIAQEYREDNEGKTIPRDDLAKALRASGVQGSDVKNLADELKRQLRATA